MVEETAPLNECDVDLFEQATQVLVQAPQSDYHQVAAALRVSSGEVFCGLHVGSRRVNICAEASAIANAVMAGYRSIDTIVAVCRDRDRFIVTNPCGVCRELLDEYSRDGTVLADVEGAVTAVAVRSLLPNPWRYPHENSWTVRDPYEQELT